MSDLKLVSAPASVRDDSLEVVGPNYDWVDSKDLPGAPYTNPANGGQWNPITAATQLMAGGGGLTVYVDPTQITGTGFNSGGIGISSASSSPSGSPGQLEFSAEEFPVARIRFRVLERSASTSWRGWFFWARTEDFAGGVYPYSSDRSLAMDEPTAVEDGEWKEILFDVRTREDGENWTGTIRGIRIDLFSAADPAHSNFDRYELDFIRFEKPQPTAVELFAARGAQTFGSAFDIQADPDLPTRYEETDGLDTAIRLSLFSDARAQAGDELPEGSGAFGEDLRGWWGDVYLDDRGELGSRLWTLKRSKMTTATRQRARDYALQALEWLVDAGIASEIEVETAVPDRGRLELYVTVIREGEVPSRFQYLWEAF